MTTLEEIVRVMKYCYSSTQPVIASVVSKPVAFASQLISTDVLRDVICH